MERGNVRFLPMGGILDRYLAQGFLHIFIISLVCTASLYLVVDFFDRISSFVDAGASMGTIVRYFVYKAPGSISRVIGFATLFSGLFCLGMLTRTQEITAMRSSGVSVHRIALPLLILSSLISGFTFLWNEALVPAFAHQAQTLFMTEVKNKQQKSLLGTADIWMRGERSFININNFDSATTTLQGITIFLLNRDLSLRGLLEIPSAHWTGRGWQADAITEWHFLPDGKVVNRKANEIAPPISETPEDLKLLAQDADEFNFFDLRKQILDMKSKGIDTARYEVDLQFKLAFPLISPLMILIAIPFALRRQMSGSIALSFAVAMLIGFGYWVVAAFCISLGHNGALPPWAAAWIPNGIFALIGLFFFTGEA
ncbi:MAG TPA: LPS export ABC transporter permease LptG [Candidatus Binatia bacterium]|nr:LPS export ABC transporter permease LptG [Candidatus Binatia bacterium]